MRVGTARSAAVQWVTEHARPDPWFRGAYFSGSTVGLPDGAELSPFSDVDVVVVTAESDPPAKPGKFRFRDALLEVSHLSWDELASADEVLSSYHLAGSFRRDTVIDDPTGRLRELRADVSRRFAERPWVRRRCLDAERRIETRLAAFDASAPFHEQVLSWLFPTGVTTHVLLVAALRNPTVRLRYPAAREVLDAYGQAHLYPELLELLGCARLSARRAGRHLDELARTFDAAAEVARTPFFFSGDITAEARPVAIDGSRHLIERGDHREAAFWIIATFARCHTVLAADAPELHRARLPAFREAVADLGVTSTEDLVRRGEEVIAFLPELRRTAGQILTANTEITE
ncbi:hypothetical protein [Streptomyces sp. NBC_01363]|uniref:hypothetical protein n=1 Tax=Streptomyces sp. NBC_01363 TaxID=2903840 RepID=UPI00224DC9C4|nr:hypothetical protein [Streptomyces sp. NBC_01363]MCX4735660.1 hypothetical protein [Streptomyces sp. NBC_01363]